MKNIILLLLFLMVLGGVGFLFKDRIVRHYFQPRTSTLPENKNQTPPLSSSQTEVVAENLEIPWEVVFLPDKSLLIPQRPGKIVRIFPENKQAIPIQGVQHIGEGGLLGLTLHPDFSTNHWLYIYFTAKTQNGLENRVERFAFDMGKNELSDEKVILDRIPASKNHDGGRIAFGPDRMLYITTGDAERQDDAQNPQTLNGKILRLKDDGSIPTDNPFNNPVYSYGHRNPQGLAWDNQGRLWETEHGPSGTQTGYDEVNLIGKGKNYGWPTIKGDQTHKGMTSPIIQSGSKETWAPGSVEIVGSTLLFVGLRGESVYTATIIGSSLQDLTAHYRQEFGRLRVIQLDPTGEWFYLATSNTDGRGTPKPGDDKIIRIPKSAL